VDFVLTHCADIRLAKNEIQNGGRRHHEFIIFVHFWSKLNVLFPVTVHYALHATANCEKLFSNSIAYSKATR